MPADGAHDLPEVKGMIKGTRPESAIGDHKKMRAEIGGGGADSDSDDGAPIAAMDVKEGAKKRRGSLIRQRMVSAAQSTMSVFCHFHLRAATMQAFLIHDPPHCPRMSLHFLPDLGKPSSTFCGASRRMRWAKSGSSTRACRTRLTLIRWPSQEKEVSTSSSSPAQLIWISHHSVHDRARMGPSASPHPSIHAIDTMERELLPNTYKH